MKLKGSCHCGAVKFSVESYTPYPYMRCYCSICRKTAGGGGYAINIMGQADTLKVQGEKNIRIYRVRLKSPGKRSTLSTARRHFCGNCASALWIYDPSWPEWIYPFASAIDGKLPVALEHVHCMLDFAANWVEVPKGKAEKQFARFPKESIWDWHQRHGILKAPAKLQA